MQTIAGCTPEVRGNRYSCTIGKIERNVGAVADIAAIYFLPSWSMVSYEPCVHTGDCLKLLLSLMPAEPPGFDELVVDVDGMVDVEKQAFAAVHKWIAWSPNAV
jgi:hypothetical protein